MVLINGLTIDEINAALIALQRSKTEVVGGEKHTTVQNISVNNTGGGSGTDFTPQILQLQRKDQELQGGIDALDTRVTDLENTLSSLTDNEIDYLEWDERTRTLYVYTTDGEEYSVDLPSETVTLSVVNNNVLRFTMGVGETNAPQVVDVTLPFIRSAEKGVAGGVATLDASGRVPYSQLPESAMEFKGEWDASTNTPHLEDGTGTNGDFYIVSTGGTVNFGTQAEPRLITFYPNDRVLYDGSAEEWKRLPAGQVISVNGQSGVVVLDATNINYDSNTTVKQAIDSKADASDVVQSDWTETDSSDPAFIKNKIPIWITTGQADDNMSPIDSVTDGSMRPITSNAVYDKIASLDVSSVGGSGKYIEAISETDGKISATVQNIADTVAVNNMQSVTSNAVAVQFSEVRKGTSQLNMVQRTSGDYVMHWAKIFSFTMGRQFSSSACVFDIIVHSVTHGGYVHGWWAGYTQVVSNPYVWNKADKMNGNSLYYGKTVQTDGSVTIDIWVPTFSDNYCWMLLGLKSFHAVTVYNTPSLITDVSGLTAFN